MIYLKNMFGEKRDRCIICALFVRNSLVLIYWKLCNED